MITVCCFLWNDPKAMRRDIYEYGPEHVHRARWQVSENLSLDHEFICVSDRPIDGITTVPLEWNTFIPGTRFAKLMLFNPNGRLTGKRILYLDLDLVVTGSINSLVERDEDLVLWRNPNFGQPLRARYNTSMILHTVGTRPEFYEQFKAGQWDKGTPDSSRQYVIQQTGYGGTDQAWVSHIARDDEAHWTSEDGVYGAGRLKKPDGALDGVGTELPDNAKIVFTPGARTPWTEGFQDQHPWAAEYEKAA